MCDIAVMCVTMVMYAYSNWCIYVAYSAMTIGELGSSIGSEYVSRNCLYLVKALSYTFTVVGAIDCWSNCVSAGTNWQAGCWLQVWLDLCPPKWLVSGIARPENEIACLLTGCVSQEYGEL